MIDLDELERLEKAATPGLWSDGTAMCCPDMGWVDGPAGKGRVCPTYEGGKRTHTLDANDAALIAAMRNALPELLRLAKEQHKSFLVEVEIGEPLKFDARGAFDADDDDGEHLK